MTTNIPSAFPVNSANLGGPGAYEAEPGMTLRDWFAGQALASVLSRLPQLRKDALKGESLSEFAAACAYEFADAMIAERAKGAA